jgi:hypothetical protein
MSKIKVNSIEAATGSTVTLPSGQTLDLSSGTVTLPNSSVNLTTKVTGTLPVANGGTGLTTLGSASQVLRVNSGATALEFATAPSGKVLQVVSTTKTDTFTVTTSGANQHTAITGLSVSITPSSASNKILIFCRASLAGSTNGIFFNVFKDGSVIIRGDADGSRTRTFSHHRYHEAYGNRDIIFQYLDSPSTTSSITYQAYGYCDDGTFYVNRSANNSDENWIARTASTITVMEIQG